jgi:hypothetical protein
MHLGKQGPSPSLSSTVPLHFPDGSVAAATAAKHLVGEAQRIESRRQQQSRKQPTGSVANGMAPKEQESLGVVVVAKVDTEHAFFSPTLPLTQQMEQRASAGRRKRDEAITADLLNTREPVVALLKRRLGPHLQQQQQQTLVREHGEQAAGNPAEVAAQQRREAELQKHLNKELKPLYMQFRSHVQSSHRFYHPDEAGQQQHRQRMVPRIAESFREDEFKDNMAMLVDFVRDKNPMETERVLQSLKQYHAATGGLDGDGLATLYQDPEWQVRMEQEKVALQVPTSASTGSRLRGTTAGGGFRLQAQPPSDPRPAPYRPITAFTSPRAPSSPPEPWTPVRAARSPMHAPPTLSYTPSPLRTPSQAIASSSPGSSPPPLHRVNSDVGQPRARSFSIDPLAATAPVGLGIARWLPDDEAPTIASTGAVETQLHAGQKERLGSTARTFRVPVTPTTARPQNFWIKQQLAEEGQGKGPAPSDIDWNFHLRTTLREGDSVEEAMWERFYERDLTHADIKADPTPPDRLPASASFKMRRLLLARRDTWETCSQSRLTVSTETTTSLIPVPRLPSATCCRPDRQI